MPVDALPYEPAEPAAGTGQYTRHYRDLLGNPLRGTATITPDELADATGVVVAPVTVDLVGGTLAVTLPAGTYTVVAHLRTAQGERATETDTVTI